MNEMNQLGTLTVEAKRDLLKTLLSIRDGQSTGVFPLSSGQQGLWFVYQLASSSPAYNFVVAARLPADVDLDALGKSFQALLCRHPALRTRFSLRDGKPIQKIDPDLPVELPRVDAREWSDEQLLRHLESRGDAPFDLEKGPSLRVEFYQRRGGEWILLLVFHHIIADLWSMDLLIEELKEIYASRRRGQEVGVTLPRSGLAEYLRNQFSNLHGPRGQKALAYWLKELGGPLPVLDLPTDRPRPAIQNYKGSTHTWRLPAKKVARLRALAGQLGTTMFPLLLSAFELLLHRYTGQGELLVGVTTADRGKPEWEKLVGYFLNQIVLRNQLQPGMTFLDLVAQVRDKLYHGLENNDYPFGELVKRLQPHRDPSRSPVFQTMFIWDRPRAMAFPESVDLSRPVESSPGTLTLEPILMEQRGAPTDLTLIVFESDTLTARLCYNTDLFHRSTIERMARHFEALLDHLVIHPQAELSEVPMLTPTERSQLLEKWGLPAPLDITDPDWLTVFERNARDHSQAVALEQEDRQLTYGEL
ncbi:MAG: condensation domain-containing protein, partial [Gemmataceae bacterium]